MHLSSSVREIKKPLVTAISTYEKRENFANSAVTAKWSGKHDDNTVVSALTLYDYKFLERLAFRFKSGCVKRGK